MNVPLQNLKASDSRSLVLGLGATGLAFTRWLARHGASARVADTREQPPGANELNPQHQLITGAFESSLLDDIDRVLVSPGVPAGEPLLAEARRRNVEIVSDIDLFVQEAVAPVVAVTGSNGKSTVVTMLSACVRALGLDVIAGGNLGTPVLDLLAAPAPDWFVLELSSFQLDRTANLPCRAATILNLTEDHLDWHGDFAHYRAAKQRILRAADCWVVNRAQPDITQTGVAPVISFGLDSPANGHYGLRKQAGKLWLARGDDVIANLQQLGLTERHLQTNALAALALVDAMGLDPFAAASGLRDFHALPHRREVVGRWDDVVWIDDSKATNVGAAVASVQAADEPVILIAGGDSKGADLSAFAAQVVEQVQAVIAMGQAAAELEAAFAPTIPVMRVDDMDEAVKHADAMAQPGMAVLLAPACASFDQFADYRARGLAFRTAVEALKR